MRASPVPSVVRGSFFVKFSSQNRRVDRKPFIRLLLWECTGKQSGSSLFTAATLPCPRALRRPSSYIRAQLPFRRVSVTVMSSNWEKAFSATPPGCEGAAWKRIVIHLEALPDEGAAKLEFTVRGRRDMSARRRREYTHTPRAPSSTHARQSTQVPTLPHRASMHRRWENTWRRTG